MNKVSKELAAEIASDIREAVEEILMRHGLAAPQVKWGYGDYFNFSVTSSAIEIGLNGVNLASPEAQYYQRFGFNAFIRNGSDTEVVKLTAPLGTIFSGKLGETFMFTGIASSRKKYPIMVEEPSSGKVFFLTESVVPLVNKSAEASAKFAASGNL